MIKIYEPYLKLDNVYRALESGWLSSQGEYINKVSEYFKELFGIKHVILQMNGTTATHCLFMALKYKYPNITKIYVPNNVYIAVYNCVMMEYPIECMSVLKIDTNTLNMDTSSEYILSLEKNACVVIIHNVGNIINVPRLGRIRPDLIFVEDNCEGLLGKYENQYTGTASLCSSISFFANKTLTSGEGGLFMTNDENVYDYIYKKCHQGMSTKRYIHDIHAYNYRMTNIQAALLYDQILIKDEILHKKKYIFDKYSAGFTNINNIINNKLNNINKLDSIIMFNGDIDTDRSRWMYVLRVRGIDFEKMSEYMKNNNIETRPFFYPINYHGHLKDITFDDTNSILLSKECIMIPSYPTLTDTQIDYIITTIHTMINNFTTVDNTHNDT